ncbi:MAG: hypothetical protein WEG36_14895 [Gemmatimonadota bacterium]
MRTGRGCPHGTQERAPVALESTVRNGIPAPARRLRRPSIDRLLSEDPQYIAALTEIGFVP